MFLSFVIRHSSFIRHSDFVIRHFPVCLLVLLVLAGSLSAGSGPEAAKSVWDPKGVEDFSLTECHGQTVTKQDLLGKPWVACFVFTRCAGPCPKVSQEMKLLQERLKGIDVRLVSFSVDPERDTPEVLRDYAESYGADPDRWWFLTGDKEVIYRLIRRSFRMIVDEDPRQIPGFEVIHSIEMMHVDSNGVVRGRYNAQDDVDMAKLRRVLLGKADSHDARLIAEAEQKERERQKLAEAARARAGAQEAPAQVPDWVLRLPAVNATLNGLATVLLLTGFACIKAKKIKAHETAMLSAFVTSMAFLASYLVYHWGLGHFGNSYGRSFSGVGTIRYVYSAILISHVFLAVAVAALAPRTLFLALTGQFVRHKRLARVTFPIWLYVSVTGVIIYLMLYHWPVLPAQ